MKATEQFLKSGFITVDIFAAAPADEPGRTAMMRRAGEGRQIACHVRRGRRGGAGAAGA